MTNDRKIIIRERTEDMQLETSYCTKCRHNNYNNIGVRRCVECGEIK